MSDSDESYVEDWRYVKPNINFNLLGLRRAEMVNAIIQQETGMWWKNFGVITPILIYLEGFLPLSKQVYW